MAHLAVITVDYVDGANFSCLHEQIRIRPGLGGEKCDSPGTHILVLSGQSTLIPRSEVVLHRWTLRQIDPQD